MTAFSSITAADFAAHLADLTSRLADLERQISAQPTSVLATLLRPDEVAERLNVSERTLAEWRVRPASTGPDFIRVGRGVRYREAKINAWLLAQEHASTVEEARA